MYKLNNIRLPLDYDVDNLAQYVINALNLKKTVTNAILVGLSLDSRKKNDIHYVAHIAFASSEITKKQLETNNNLFEYFTPQFEIMTLERKNHKSRPIIIGSGPSGLFCALILARKGLRPIIIEQGECVEKRAFKVDRFWSSGELDELSNVQFGEGGAGTFSDGKLNTGTNNKYNYLVLKTFVEYGAKEDILYMNKPHIGTDYLIKILSNLRKDIENLGGEYHFNTKAIDFLIQNGKINGVLTVENGQEKQYDSDIVVLAIGHSSRDTFYMLEKRGVSLEAKDFAIGMRIEHKQKWLDLAQYGCNREVLKLPAADYKLATRVSNGRNVFSFCMCPGGVVVPATSEKGSVVVNGMSYNSRNENNSNSAILCNVTKNDFKGTMGGIELQQSLEKRAYNVSNSYKAPCQKVEDFIAKRPTKKLAYVIPSYSLGTELCEMDAILPNFIAESIREAMPLFARKIKNFDKEAVFTAIETRTSSPIRILRDEKGMANLYGLYPIGEGSGYAGGITSSAVDGIKTAEKILINIGE